MNHSIDEKLKGRRILIVDDVPKNLRFLELFLTGYGFKIDLAASGQEALARVEALPPDLILLDIMMPGMDGFEVCAKLKEMPEFSRIPIIFLTARMETTDLVRAFKSGAVDYITKPVQLEELLARAVTHLNLEVMRAEQEKAAAELRELNANQNRYFSILSHDLREPFTALISFPRLLEEEFDFLSREDVMLMAKEARRKAELVLNLLENLLTWSKGQMKQITFNPYLLSANEIMEEVVESVEAQASRKEIQIDRSVKPHDFKLVCDAPMLATVIRNLVNNAIKFTPRGGVVFLSAWQQGAEAVFQIMDHGVGMTQEKQRSLFKIEEQVISLGTEQERGTGLGLLICRQFIDRHSGRIEIESEINKGTAVRCIFPTGNIEA